MYKKVLILAPHTDDGELGCGGTIAKLIEEGSEVYYAGFSVCEISVPEGLPKNILEIELRKATKVLGIKPENLFLFNYPVRTFPDNRQAILQHLIDIRSNINPDLVFMPCINDIHQDHQTIANEGVRAFKNTTVLGYEMLWNNLSINTQAFFILNEEHVKKKIEAFSCYESQKFRNYANEEFIKGLASTRGTQINEKYAEVFEVIRWVIR